MKVTVNIDCTPEEARAFMGLPDLAPLNEHFVNEMKNRMSSLAPEELMKTWYAQAGQAQEHFMNLMMSGGSKS
jgi:hypothetical protein